MVKFDTANEGIRKILQVFYFQISNKRVWCIKVHIL